MSKHSDGPWSIGTPPPNGEQTIGTTQGLMVAVATTGASVPTKASARLIAAAPDLLEALRGMFAMWRSVCRAQGWEPEHLAEAVRAQAAIAKATGDRP